jgi:hypothetical protein
VGGAIGKAEVMSAERESDELKSVFHSSLCALTSALPFMLCGFVLVINETV